MLLQVIGRACSINVRKVLWTCAEIGLSFEHADVERWMDWQATELNNAWHYAFLALVRKSPAHTDAAQIAASTTQWNRHIGLLDAQLQRTGAFVTGTSFTLADVVLGLCVQRWLMTPRERPTFAAVAAHHARLLDRPGFRAWGANGEP